MVGGYVWANLTEVPPVMHTHKVSSNRDGFRCCCSGEGVNAVGDAYVETLQTLNKQRSQWKTPPSYSVVKREVNKHPQNTKSSSPMEAIVRGIDDLNEDYLTKACIRFRTQIEWVIEAKGGYVELHLSRSHSD
ncbi:hypothetical protein ACTXT7_006470 [Hymenolepis weldensis]